MLHKLTRVMLTIALYVAGCSSDEPSLERRGGEVPEPTGAGGDSDSGAGGDSGTLVPFCDALVVIRAKCQRCHQDPPQNGAPAPFLTYEDTQAQYGSSGLKFSELMVDDVGKGFMPLVSLNDPPTTLMPPVEPLTAQEKATLMAWLEQGAKPEGGTDCP
jgi:hypothetical protein